LGVTGDFWGFWGFGSRLSNFWELINQCKICFRTVSQASSITGFINAENKLDILGHLEPHNIDITLYMGKECNIGIMVLKIAHYLKFFCSKIEISS
jgi:hypothetical protein